MRCFSFEPGPDCPSDTIVSAFGAFQGWVVKKAQRVEALQLKACGPYLACCEKTLQHLKHVDMDAHDFACGVAQRTYTLLPSLQTLCLHERGQGNEGISVLGCQHLRRLVVKGRYLRPVLHEPKCQLGIHMHGFTSRSLFCWVDHWRILDDRNDVVWAENSHEPHPEGGVCGDIRTARRLKLAWPIRQESTGDKHPDSDPLPSAESMLRWCMPVSGQPLGNLRALTITAEGAMECEIPNAMPNLEELVIFAKGKVRVHFDDPVATLTPLKTLYLFGQPMMPKIHNAHLAQVSASMASRGLLLSFVSASDSGSKPLEYISAYLGRCDSCLYVRPITAQELSTDELHDRVSKLARQCRCMACFECLRLAGCLKYC